MVLCIQKGGDRQISEPSTVVICLVGLLNEDMLVKTWSETHPVPKKNPTTPKRRGPMILGRKRHGKKGCVWRSLILINALKNSIVQFKSFKNSQKE